MTEPLPAPSPLDWAALRDFLAVADSGSLSEAARRLGVSQPTLTRRMAALEESLRAELFHRSSRGLALTEVGEAILAPVRQMEREAQEVELAATGRDRALAGLVRITATEGLAVGWLTPRLAEFRARHPDIQVELIIRNTALNVLRREADIAIRLGRPRQVDLVAKRVGELALGLYASRAYLEAEGQPASQEDLSEHRGVAFDEGEVHTGAGSWVESRLEKTQIVYRANTLSAQRQAILAGLGIGAQACFIAEREPTLARIAPDVAGHFEIWLVTHPGLRRSARIRALYDYVAKSLEEDRALLAGAPR